MKFDKRWIKEKKPYAEILRWLLKQENREAEYIISKLISEKRWQWAEWAISRSLSQKQNVLWAVFCAEQVLHVFENKYPNDKRPRAAIKAAKDLIGNPSAAYAVYAATYAAYAADQYDEMRAMCIRYGLKLLEEAGG